MRCSWLFWVTIFESILYTFTRWWATWLPRFRSRLFFIGALGGSDWIAGPQRSGHYLIPAVIGCSWVAFFALKLIQRKKRPELWTQIHRGLLLIIPMIYPIGILALLAINIIPRPIDTRAFGPEYIPWREAADFVMGGPAEHWRDAILMITVPLLIVRGKNGFFLFLYLCAVWLLCLNPLLAHLWMKNILASCYFRLVYLLQIPLLCAMLAAAGSRLAQPGSFVKARLATLLPLFAVLVSFLYGYRGLS